MQYNQLLSAAEAHYKGVSPDWRNPAVVDLRSLHSWKFASKQFHGSEIHAATAEEEQKQFQAVLVSKAAATAKATVVRRNVRSNSSTSPAGKGMLCWLAKNRFHLANHRNTEFISQACSSLCGDATIPRKSAPQGTSLSPLARVRTCCLILLSSKHRRARQQNACSQGTPFCDLCVLCLMPVLFHPQVLCPLVKKTHYFIYNLQEYKRSKDKLPKSLEINLQEESRMCCVMRPHKPATPWNP